MGHSQKLRSVNHALKFMGASGSRRRWLSQMAALAASELLRTHNPRSVVRAVRQELTNCKIAGASIKCITHDAVNGGPLAGRAYVLEYDRTKSSVEIGAATIGGCGSYLLTANGAFLHGNKNSPVTAPQRIDQCQKLREIVIRHDPELGKRLMVLAA